MRIACRSVAAWYHLYEDGNVRQIAASKRAVSETKTPSSLVAMNRGITPIEHSSPLLALSAAP
jgi:hypothetical protein